MKSLSYLLAILGSVTAQVPSHITLIAISSNPAYANQVIAAERANWWINGTNDEYCPDGATDCASYSNTTTVAVASNGTASMWNGGGAMQTLYIDPSTGFVSFIVPVRNAYLPPGALLQDFTVVKSDIGFELQFQGGNGTSFTACPLHDDSPEVYGVAIGTNANLENCAGGEEIRIGAGPAAAPGAYVYGNTSPCISYKCPP